MAGSTRAIRRTTFRARARTQLAQASNDVSSVLRSRHDLSGLEGRYLRDPAAQWSAGTYSAIAEFSRDPDEPANVFCSELGGEASTARGAVRVELGPKVRAVEYESATKKRDQWGQAIAFCLPAHEYAMVVEPLSTNSGRTRW
jgi:hypothetical protein